MNKWNLIVDVAECHNCNNCFLACKDEHVGNDIPGYSAPQPLHGHKWINIQSRERGSWPIVDTTYVPTMCNHCDDAPCVKQGEGAVEKRADGIVIINPQKAKGRKDLVDSCPYGAIWWNEEHDVPQSWTFDAHLLDQGWKEPRCVQSCPTAALKSVKVSDAEMKAIIQAENLVPLRADLNTAPRVHYKNLGTFTSLFVAGEVVAHIDGVEECLSGATATLDKDGKNLGTITTDAFGEFKIDGLNPDIGKCELTISHPQYGATTIEITLDDQCIVTDTIQLTN